MPGLPWRLRLARGLRGSSNEQYWARTGRYTPESLAVVPELEITIGADATATITGMAPVPGRGCEWGLRSSRTRSGCTCARVALIVLITVEDRRALETPMSHFTRVRTTLRDPELIVRALAAVGFGTVEHHQSPQTLYGYRGDARPERAEVIVRRRYIGTASNDIGFRRRGDGGFEAIISEYDRAKYDQGWLTKLTRAYGHAAALRYAEENGYEVDSDEVDEKGERRLVLRRYT